MTDLLVPVLSAASTAFAGLAVWLIKENRKAKAVENERDAAVITAVLAIVRINLTQAHRSAVRRWEISAAELDAFRELHAVYTGLGGNGPTSALLEDVKRMKLV